MSTMYGILIFMSFLSIVIYIPQQFAQLQKKLQYQQKQLHIIAQKLGVSENEIDLELRHLVENGNKIKAIKTARDVMGLSLLEAKQYVDAL